MTYWNGGGEFKRLYVKYQKQADNGDVRQRMTMQGELFHAVSKIYYDYNNNGLGNDTSSYAGFLIDNMFDKIKDKIHKRLEDEVVEFLKNHTGSDYGVELTSKNNTIMENMMSRVLVYIDKELSPKGMPNTEDSSSYTSNHTFVRNDERLDEVEDPWDMPDDDPYYQDEERLQDEL